VSVSRETQTSAYVSLLQRWGRTLNLTSPKQNSEEGLRDLIADSLTIVPYLPSRLDRLIDLGSGQGFPAIPIAIETGLSIDLIESDRRKAAFLTTTMAHLGLKGHVWPMRIERASLPAARCVTAKALAPLPTLIELARPLLTQDGWCLFLKGPSAAKEVPSQQPCDGVQIDILPTPRPASTIVKVSALR
jgi:16S rRNA (guanine527-N7)-methyltransferase